MDLVSFAQATVAGVPLVLVIMGLVEWFKRFHKRDGTAMFSGNGLLLVSMGLGLLFGGLYMVSQQRPPVGDWWTVGVYWFAVAVYGLMMGLVASGIYEVAKSLVEKLFAQLIKAMGK